jgi:hypothetical protein
MCLCAWSALLVRMAHVALSQVWFAGTPADGDEPGVHGTPSHSVHMGDRFLTGWPMGGERLAAGHRVMQTIRRRFVDFLITCRGYEQLRGSIENHRCRLHAERHLNRSTACNTAPPPAVRRVARAGPRRRQRVRRPEAGASRPGPGWRQAVDEQHAGGRTHVRKANPGRGSVGPARGRVWGGYLRHDCRGAALRR